MAEWGQVGFESSWRCPFCGHAMTMQDGRYGRYYRCVGWPECDGIQQVGEDGEPRGQATDKATRELRKLCHDCFDSFWLEERVTRKQAYALLSYHLDILPRDCHFGLFDEMTCRRALQAINQLDRELPPPPPPAPPGKERKLPRLSDRLHGMLGAVKHREYEFQKRLSQNSRKAERQALSQLDTMLKRGGEPEP